MRNGREASLDIEGGPLRHARITHEAGAHDASSS
jgi:hypothetical protein